MPNYTKEHVRAYKRWQEVGAAHLTEAETIAIEREDKDAGEYVRKLRVEAVEEKAEAEHRARVKKAETLRRRSEELARAQGTLAPRAQNSTPARRPAKPRVEKPQSWDQFSAARGLTPPLRRAGRW
jgi:hypothetical protein